MNKNIIKQIALLILVILITDLSFQITAFSTESNKVTVYFYSSETHINNFKSLKIEFDTYLSASGPYEFQPFKDRQTFEDQIKDKKECILLMSSWHYRNICKQLSLHPVLAGSKDGNKYQKRILVSMTPQKDSSFLERSIIASASTVQHTQSTLSEMFGNGITAEKTQILTVPKDIDALMSVGLGMAQSALTTESALEKLKTINSVLYDKLNPIAEDKQSLLMILAVPTTFKNCEHILNILRNISNSDEGKKKMRMLGLDGWQTLSPSDISQLEG